jgi:hypothetical protein
VANDRKDGGKALQQERLALRRQLSQLSSKQKHDALIDSANARALVRSMPAEELYFAIADVGLADTADMSITRISHFSSIQLTVKQRRFSAISIRKTRPLIQLT